MTNEERKVMELALEALEKSQQILNEYMTECVTARQANNEAITAMKELLAQPEQEPVAWMYEYWDDHHDAATGGKWRKNMTCMPLDLSNCRNVQPLYTTPPQRKPMNDEMYQQMRESCDSDNMEMRGAFIDGWTSAEAAHGIKE